MPRYTFACQDCGASDIFTKPVEECETDFVCECGGTRERDLLADLRTVTVDTSGCRDHNNIPRAKRVYREGSTADATRLEGKYAKHVSDRRKQLADGGNQGSIKQSHAIPADLYHGKIRETGDKQYWQDKKNMSRHNDFKVG